MKCCFAGEGKNASAGSYWIDGTVRRWVGTQVCSTSKGVIFDPVGQAKSEQFDDLTICSNRTRRVDK